MARALCFALLALLACVDQGPGPTPRKIDASYIRQHLLEVAPTNITRFDVDIGDGAVTYLGNRVDKPRLSPGAQVTLTHYWKVNRPLDKKWRPFTIVRGLPNTADFINVSTSDMMYGHPPSKWKPGQIVEDVHPILIRPDWSSKTAKILVGFIEEGKHGPLDRIAVAGQPTEDRAIVAATLDIDLSRAPPRPGTYHIPRATTEVVIDGVPGDPAWASATISPEFITAEGSGDPIGKATAKMVWDDLHLYVLVQVQDNDIFSPYKQKDEPVWKSDCVELFIDADGNRRGYVELQVSPNNVVFDSWFASTRAQPGDVTWDSGMKTAVKVRGNAAVAGDSGDQGWDAEIAIPWAAVKGKDPTMKVTLPPAVGDQWRLNIVRVDRRSVGNAQMASSWNRISQADYHALDRMLVAKFADATGSIVPGATPAPTQAAGSGSAGSGSAGSGSAGSGSARAPLPSYDTKPNPQPSPTGSGSAIELRLERAPAGTGSGSGSATTTTTKPVPKLAPPAPTGSVKPAPAGSDSPR